MWYSEEALGFSSLPSSSSSSQPSSQPSVQPTTTDAPSSVPSSNLMSSGVQFDGKMFCFDHQKVLISCVTKCFNSSAVNSQTCTYLLLSTLSQPSDEPSMSSQPPSTPQVPSLHRDLPRHWQYDELSLQAQCLFPHNRLPHLDGWAIFALVVCITGTEIFSLL